MRHKCIFTIDHLKKLHSSILIAMMSFLWLLQPRFADDNSDAARLTFQMAESLFHENQVDYALRSYYEYIDLYPHERDIYHAYERVAEIQIRKQNFQKAVQIYQNLYYMAGPGEKGLIYLYARAELLDKMGMVDERNRLLAQILSISPDSEAAEKARILLRFDTLFNADDLPPSTESQPED